MVQYIIKRNGETCSFNPEKIKLAIAKALKATNVSEEFAVDICDDVCQNIWDGMNVEQIQDIVEKSLMEHKLLDTARAYIRYRDDHNRKREKVAGESLKDLNKQSMSYFGSVYEYIVYLRTYSQWIHEKQRRETWIETVDRYFNFMRENLGDRLSEDEYSELRKAVLKMEVMPSMRLLQFAGQAARRNNICIYNCCYVAPKSLEDLRDIMYICMCGTGVGWSVEEKVVKCMPDCGKITGNKLPTHVVADSREGWCDAFYLGLRTWFAGDDIEFDFSKVRPAGARLLTTGGRASGPKPLEELLTFTRRVVRANAGGRLSSLDMHDLLCMIGRIVQVGGVRRSAMISLSDLKDESIRHCKDGVFYIEHPQRTMANNSAVYNEKPSDIQFMEEWLALAKSGSGERGIFNRSGFKYQLPQRRLELLGDRVNELGTNPCGEIILQSCQFCNLTTIKVTRGDTTASLLRKIKYATILGTYQASLTDFHYVDVKFKRLAEEERLLGVSMTGQFDNIDILYPDTLSELKNVSIETNKIYAERFGISQSTSITCVKPEGTTSEMLGCASGMHPRHSKYYIRRIRISAHDPLFKLLKDQGVVYHPEIGQPIDNPYICVMEFPMKSPEGSITKDEVSAQKMLEYWKNVKKYYCEHNPSVTVNVNNDEWLSCANWLLQNWEIVGGLSFLPNYDMVYKLAPLEAISESKYNELKEQYDRIKFDFSKLIYYEMDNSNIEIKKSVACIGDKCMLE